MTLLSSTELRKLIQANPPLLENAIDIETQIQPNGLELTLKEIKTIEGPGALDFDNTEENSQTQKRLNSAAMVGFIYQKGFTKYFSMRF